MSPLISIVSKTKILFWRHLRIVKKSKIRSLFHNSLKAVNQSSLPSLLSDEKLIGPQLVLPAMKVLKTTLLECVLIASRIMANKEVIRETESNHLLELSKMHITLSLAAIRAGKFSIETFMDQLNNCDINHQINKCVDDICHNLVMIEATLDGCKTIGINSNDTLKIYEFAIRLLCDQFLQLRYDPCLPPLTSVDKVYQDFHKLRPIVYEKSIISLKSDRNENFLGTPGPNPVYMIGGVTELTTRKFGDYAKFEIGKVSNWDTESGKTDTMIGQQESSVKYGDEVGLYYGKWGFIRHYFTGLCEQSWWEYNRVINERAIFRLVHPIESDITRELRFGDRVCLEIIIGKNNAWSHRYLSGKLNSRVLKLSSTPQTWTVYNDKGILNSM